MSEQDIETLAHEALELAEKMTPLPWEWEVADANTLGLGTEGAVFAEGTVLWCDRCRACVSSEKRCAWPSPSDGDYIEHACNNAPALARAVLERGERVRELESDAVRDRRVLRGATDSAIALAAEVGRLRAEVERLQMESLQWEKHSLCAIVAERDSARRWAKAWKRMAKALYCVRHILP